MLQFTVWSQLAGLKFQCNFRRIQRNFSSEFHYLSPIKTALNKISNTMDRLDKNDKHFFINGERSLIAAVKLLRDGKIIAIPTDTVYGLAALADDSKSLAKLYEIKGRDKSKPLAICVSKVSDIEKWGEIQHLSSRVITALLPGPVTIVVKRKPELNPFLNPGSDTVAIRVISYKFVKNLTWLLDQPLALTSANSSNDPSSLAPEEFLHLWPLLGGIFYDIPNEKKMSDSYRLGSTIVDLITPNEFKIIRRGIHADQTQNLLRAYGLKENDK